MFNNKNLGYIDNLLILRGLACMGVMVTHCLDVSAVSVKNTPLNNSPLWEHGLKQIWPYVGANFVMYFFVLSGYLMGKVFFEKRYLLNFAGIKRFYKSRMLRIAPLLYFNLLICAVIKIAVFHDYLPPIRVLGDLLFLNNYTLPTINTVSWSLSVEMQYYILFAPLFAFVFRKITLSNLLLLTLTAAVIFILGKQVVALREYGMSTNDFLIFFLGGFSVNFLLHLFRVSKFHYSDALAFAFCFFGGNIAFYFFSISGKVPLGIFCYAFPPSFRFTCWSSRLSLMWRKVP